MALAFQGGLSFEDNKHARRTSTRKTEEYVEKIGKLTQEDRRLAIQELADKAKICYGIYQAALAGWRI